MSPSEPAGRALAKVVVVDDEERLVSLVASYLEEHGVAAVRCYDGPSGLAAAREPGVDVVVLDVMLPGMTGLEVCATLRASGSTVPVLMATARGTAPQRIAGGTAGADDYLVKPFSLDDLLRRVRRLHSRRQRTSSSVAE